MNENFCEPLPPRRLSSVADDYSVQATNDDAAESKASAVHLGYWQDKFLKFFVKNPERKPPEIHRGYYARVQLIKMLVDEFLNISGNKGQIVNLGAGFDTLYWRLMEENREFRKFVELDFSSITAKKIAHICKPHFPLKKYVSENETKIVQSEHRDLLGPRYCLIGADIRDTSELSHRMAKCDLDYSLPTLFISECVLLYMSADQSTSLVKFLADQFPLSCFINYDLVNLDDKFGEVFKQNMCSRGLPLAGVNICQNLQSQIERFSTSNWEHVKGYLMTKVYENYISEKERERIEKIEFLDEKELLTQLLKHYCVVVAVNDRENFGLKKIFFEEIP